MTRLVVRLREVLRGGRSQLARPVAIFVQREERSGERQLRLGQLPRIAAALLEQHQPALDQIAGVAVALEPEDRATLDDPRLRAIGVFLGTGEDLLGAVERRKRFVSCAEP